MTIFSKISIILSIICAIWLVGLAVFCIIRAIVLKVKAKKEIKKYDK